MDLKTVNLQVRDIDLQVMGGVGIVLGKRLTHYL